MMKPSLSPLLIPLILLCAAPQAFGTDEPLSCADHSIVAHDVHTTEDVQAFVQCAYEFVQEVGFAQARRAFNEDARWKSGPIYVFVDEITSMTDTARAFIFPPNTAREGEPWGALIDVWGNDYYKEAYRLISNFGEGWIHYSFKNPATGRNGPKASYRQEYRLGREPGRDRSGHLPPRPSRHLRERRGQRHDTGRAPVRGAAQGVRPLRRHGARIDGILRTRLFIG